MKTLLLMSDGSVEFLDMMGREKVTKAGGGNMAQATKQSRDEDPWLSQLVRSHAAVPIKPKGLMN